MINVNLVNPHQIIKNQHFANEKIKYKSFSPVYTS